MKQSVGSIPTYTLIAVFLIIIFAFLAAIMSYYKAFKMNSRVSSVIERCEGYNSCSIYEINRLIKNYWYNVQGKINCPEKSGGELEVYKSGICIYYFDNDGSSDRYSYGVVTFMIWDLPVINKWVKLPIFSKTDRLYKF